MLPARLHNQSAIFFLSFLLPFFPIAILEKEINCNLTMKLSFINSVSTVTPFHYSIFWTKKKVPQLQ